MENFTDDLIRDQLARILASSKIRNSNILSEFLKYIVNETLLGKAPQLKEYTIGTSALNKEVDFNPQLDSIVRIHAGRLRRVLQEYYLEEGKDDPVLIQIPKGSYVPLFLENQSTSKKVIEALGSGQEPVTIPVVVATSAKIHEREKRPTILVVPFSQQGKAEEGSYLAISEYLSTELTKFENIIVLSHHFFLQSIQSLDLSLIPSRLGVDYLLTGTVQALGDKVRIFVQLTSSLGRQLWGHTFEKQSHQKDEWSIEEEVVNKTLASIMGFSGIIARLEANELPKVASLETERVLSFWYKQSTYNFDPLITAQARKYYEDFITTHSNNALAHAYLSEVITCQTYFTDPAQRSAMLESSRDFAHRAITIDPACQHAYQALALVTVQEGNQPECIRILEKGFSINPKSVDYAGSMGALLIFLGHYEKGYELMQKAMPMNPDPPWGHLISLSFYFLYKGAYETAITWLSSIKVKIPWIPVVQIAAYALAGDFKTARQLKDEFVNANPMMVLTAALIDNMFPEKELASRIKSGMDSIDDLILFE